MDLGYTIQTTSKRKQEIVDKWAAKHGASKKTSQFRNVGMTDMEYATGQIGTQDELFDYTEKEKVFPYTQIEYTVINPSDICRKEFFVIRGFLADIKTEKDIKAIGY